MQQSDIVHFLTVLEIVRTGGQLVALIPKFLFPPFQEKFRSSCSTQVKIETLL
jgi:hypothetical protein